MIDKVCSSKYTYILNHDITVRYFLLIIISYTNQRMSFRSMSFKNVHINLVLVPHRYDFKEAEAVAKKLSQLTTDTTKDIKKEIDEEAKKLPEKTPKEGKSCLI